MPASPPLPRLPNILRDAIITLDTDRYKPRKRRVILKMRKRR